MTKKEYRKRAKTTSGFVKPWVARWAGVFVSATPTARYPHGPSFIVGSSGLADAWLEFTIVSDAGHRRSSETTQKLL